VALAAIGETVLQVGGVIDIGLEGSMLASAFFGMLASYQFHSGWIGLVAGVAAGVISCLIFGYFTIVLGNDQVVVGTATNLLLLGLTSTLFRAEFGQSGKLLSVDRLPAWGGVDPLMIAMLLGVFGAWFLIRRTAWGLALRAAGEYPPAVEASGLSVVKLRLQALIFAGIFAGLGGSYLSLVITGSFAENMTAGRGFIAIAMVTFGRWKPSWVFVASLLIGLAGSLQFWLQGKGWNVPYQLFVAMPYLLALLVLVLVGKGARSPKALAQPYRKQ
jgi:ABC-type uncharacterized transport system permease subunit